jgi:regulator of cell morphogenesis and NO signaling
MYSTLTVRDIVNRDYRTADVFTKYGINFCSNGNMSLTEVCSQQHLDQSTIEADLQEASKRIHISNKLPFNEWPIEFLVDYVLYVHHGYIKQAGPVIAEQLKMVTVRHKMNYPELEQVNELFQDLLAELMEHLETEEEKIFPYIKQICNTYNRKEVYGKLFVRTLRKPLTEIVEKEYNRITACLKELRKLTNYYTSPSDACPKVQVIYHKLHDFDHDLVQHKHLENNILVPRALSMEKELLHL